MKKYFVEFFGTFTLTLIVMLSVAGKFPVPTPILAAAVVGTFVYTVGFISGVHVNPAVTIGAWSVKKISDKDAVAYVISQFVGALLALFISSFLVEAKIPQLSTTPIMGLGELIGTMLLTFGVASVVFGKTDKQLAGLVVGASLFIGIAAGGVMGSAGVINPAVSFGLGLFNPIYISGQIIGGVLGFWIFKMLIEK
ncbi:MAG TPA: aquaporin [Candidatus Acidoferrales bacterium]|nr:aquaporin [Candidatus Acidoferrales bacterium]